MGITNDNYKSLYKNPLKYNDTVYFTYNNNVYTYRVLESFLYNIDRPVNCEIFNILQIDKEQLAKKAYGYDLERGDWPVCECEDYAALTRLVILLFEEIKRKENPETFTKSTSSNPIKIKIKIEPQIKIKLK